MKSGRCPEGDWSCPPKCVWALRCWMCKQTNPTKRRTWKTERSTQAHGGHLNQLKTVHVGRIDISLSLFPPSYDHQPPPSLLNSPPPWTPSTKQHKTASPPLRPVKEYPRTAQVCRHHITTFPLESELMLSRHRLPRPLPRTMQARPQEPIQQSAAMDQDYRRDGGGLGKVLTRV